LRSFRRALPAAPPSRRWPWAALPCSQASACRPRRWRRPHRLAGAGVRSVRACSTPWPPATTWASARPAASTSMPAVAIISKWLAETLPASCKAAGVGAASAWASSTRAPARALAEWATARRAARTPRKAAAPMPPAADTTLRFIRRSRTRLRRARRLYCTRPVGGFEGRRKVMTSNLFRAALGCAAVVFAATTADATVTPSSSTPIILEHDPAGIVATAPTDGDGRVTFRNLAPGKYVLVIDGSALAASLNRLTTRKKESSGGVSFGIGGSLFGGGHSGSGHTGAGPVGGGHGSTRSGTGGNIGIGTTIPIGGS